jgi:hypothetical protein
MQSISWHKNAHRILRKGGFKHVTFHADPHRREGCKLFVGEQPSSYQKTVGIVCVFEGGTGWYAVFPEKVYELSEFEGKSE